MVVLFGLGVQAPAWSQQRVDVAILLAVDASASVDAREFRLQMSGIADAMRDPDVVDAIGRGPLGAIAVSVVQWSSLGEQLAVIPWTRIAGPSDARVTAEQIRKVPRVFGLRGTAIGDAIVYATAHMKRLPFRADRLVIDVSGDGKNNHPPLLKDARVEALRHGITINGLPIISDDPSIHYYYNDAVIGGPGAFIEVAADFDDFAVAMKRKLIREIRGPVVSGLDRPVVSMRAE